MRISMLHRLVWIAALAAGTAMAQELEVTGRVLGRDGAGLAAARLELAPLLPAYRRAELELAGEAPPAAIARVQTSGDGGYRLAAPPGFWQVVVRHANYLPARLDLAPLLDGRELPDVRLERRSEVAARLVDAGDEPLAGVELRVIGWSAAWQAAAKQGWWPAERATRTGPGGTAALPCAAGERVSVAALAGERFVHRVVDCAPALLELRLEGELRAARLVHPGGDPAAGVPAAGVYGFVRWPFLAFGSSAGDGRLRGPFDWQGDVPVAFAGAEADYGEPRWPAPGGDGLPILELPVTVPVSGRLLDAVDERPVPDAWLWTGGGRHFREVSPDGAFRLRLRAGDAVAFGAPGYLAIRYPPPAAGALDARLTPALALAGRVVDARGAAIAGARVRAPRPPWSLRGDVEGAGRWLVGAVDEVTGGDGGFEVENLAPRTRYALRVAAMGYVPARVRVPARQPGAAAEELVITLERGRTGFGLVLNEREMPIGGAEVTLLPSLTGDAAELDFQVAENFGATTDADGAFTLRDLPAGTFYLSARARGFPELLVPGVEIAAGAADAGPVDLGTVILVPGIALSGRVVDAGSAPVAGAELSLRDADGEQIVVQRAASPWFASARSLDNGSFRFDGLPRDRRLTLLAVADGFLPRELAVATGGDDQRVTVELSAGAAVSGRVLDPAGRPAAGAVVDLMPQPRADRVVTSTPRSATSGDDGRFEVAGLLPDDYRLTARAGAAESEARRLTVTAAGVEGLELQLRHKATLEVTVRDPEGTAVAGAWVQASPAGEASPPRRVAAFSATGSGGVAALEPLDDGRYVLRSRHSDYEPVEIEVQVAGAGTQQVELRFETRSGETRVPVAGRVVDPSGLPVEGARVSLAEPGGRGHAVSAPDGTFELAATPGEASLTCRHPRYAAWVGEPFVVGDGGVSDLVVELSEGTTVTGRVFGLEPEDLSRLVVVARGPYRRQEGLEVFGQLYGAIDFEGRYRVEGLGPGEWVVRAELLNPTRSASERIEVGRGEREVRVDLRFEAGYRLTGSVLRLGVPVAGATVRLRCAGEFRGQTFTDGEGRFAVDHVPAGGCTVSSTDPAAGAAARRELEVAFDTEVVLDLRPGG